MIRSFASVMCAAFLLVGCQVGGGYYFAPFGDIPGESINGSWASGDGVFIATFQGGKFTSRFTQTNEILAQGTYRPTGGNSIQLSWFSIATRENRSATCNRVGRAQLQCQQAGAGTFSLTKQV